MISFILFLLGVALVYTGILMADRDSTMAVAAMAAGAIVLIKPVLDAVRSFRAQSGQKPGGGGRKRPPRKSHIRLVHSQKERPPTIH